MVVRFSQLLSVCLLAVDLSLVIVLGLAAQTAAPPVANAAGARYIAPLGTDAGACADSNNPCASVQYAVDVAASGDEIRVAAGRYNGMSVRPRSDRFSTGTVTQVVYISKTVHLLGGFTTTNWLTADPAANITMLDAQQQGRVVYITGDISPTVDGFWLVHGSAFNQGGAQGDYDAGSGVLVYRARSTIRNTVIASNSLAFSGGGVYLLDSLSTLSDNRIFNNTGEGGGLMAENSPATVSNNSIFDNVALGGYGGAVYWAYQGGLLSGNLISHNLALQGGGVFLLLANITLSQNLILSNSASYAGADGQGGAVYMESSKPLFVNNVIADNRTRSEAGGVYMLFSQPRFIHNTFARNQGGDGSVIVLSRKYNSISTAAFTNTILVSQTTAISVAQGSTATLNGVLWYANSSNTAGLGAIDVNHATTGDPAFAVDGYHLRAGSAAINAGIPASVATDIDGQPRIFAPDLGADEFTDFQLVQTFLPLIVR